ncbi:MAG: CoA ester lyase [Anaeromyxobacter sp.]|nr:CoA ester lyase [Anaeromyxobacter sp.]MBL0276917.1 CoA ester lyase [Anaeromyxobacter sp.]
MTPAVRPRRSALYMPGQNARALEKARGLDADVLLLDLEDAVAPAAKGEARRLVVEALRTGGYGHRELVVRVNGRGTPWEVDDLAAVATSGADAVLLPKVEDPAAVREVEAALARLGAPPSLRLWAMIETPRGVLRAAEVAAATPRLACLVAGTSDLVKDLGARHTAGRAEVLTALSLIVLSARAHGLGCLDGVHLDLTDEAGFEAACLQGRDLGFDGKTLIHPKTLAVANRTFGPSPAELEAARRIMVAHAEAESFGQGVVVVDGRLVEALHVDGARRLLALAEALGSRGRAPGSE